ncbi:MAG TPA: thiopurine S-methyltransferase, partial [Marinobacter hydrocarbonoclasticus]|nr:thiopurine S-methyltransferase [Marinobacter nauticus]
VLKRDMARDNPFAKRRGLRNGATESVFTLVKK